MKNFLLASIICLLISSTIYAQETGYAQKSGKFTLQQAIEMALENNYEIQKQRFALNSAKAQFNQAKGSLDIEAGAKAKYSANQNPVDKDDPNYTINAYDVHVGNTLSQQTGGSVFLKKLFSFGLETRLSYTVQRTKNSPDYEYGSNFYSYGFSKYEDEKARSNGEIALEMSLPLFKSFKDSITALQIDAAKDYIEQMEFALSDTISQTLLNVSEKYWNYLLCSKNVEQLETMQKQIERRISSMATLIQAGVRSRNDLLALQVNASENRRSLQNARVQCSQAKMELLSVLGLSDPEAIGKPEDSFSILELQSMQTPKSSDLTEEFFSKIIEKRTDLKALKKRVDMAEKSVRLSQIDKRPDANLNFGIGASGAAYSDNLGKTLSSGFSNVKGVNISGELSVSTRLGNHTKKGAEEEAFAEYETRLADYNKAKNSLVMQIRNSAEKLEIYKNLVKDADTVLSLQKNLYENERKRFNAGLITVDEVLSQDQRYISAQLSYYQVLINYMQAILEFKYYTAQLVKQEPSEQ